jgi:hypothetical protein
MKRAYGLMIAALLTGCGVSPQDKSSLDSFVDTRAKWSDPSNIPVCFMNPEAYGGVADRIKTHVTENYNRTKNIRFVWLGKCNNSTPTYSIRVKLVSQSALGGASGVSYVGPVRISTSKETMSIVADNTYWWYGTDVHEFGHAVGLLHEHQRADQSDCNRQSKISEGYGRTYIGEYDADSVMSYCSRMNDLTEEDIRGLNALYSDKPKAATGGGKATDSDVWTDPYKGTTYPYCKSAIDEDGDGWGWENEKSCKMR